MQKVDTIHKVNTDKPCESRSMPVYRSSKFDNIKGMLIFLVVLCHLFELFGGGVRYSIYNWVYIFHMPVFVFVSGYFAKFDLKRISFRQIYPYIIFQALYCLAFAGKVQMHTPYWILWYMFCLAVWCLSLCVIKKRLPVWICVAFAVALVTGYIDAVGSRFSLSRMICFYPFFLLGVYCRTRGIGVKKLRGEKRLGTALLVFGVVLTFILMSHVKTNWLYHSMPYSHTGCTPLLRGAILGVALLWCGGILLLTTEKNIPLVSAWGRYSICIYLLHGFLQRFFMIYWTPFVFTQTINILVALCITVTVCICAGNRYMLYAIRPFVDLTFFGEKLIIKKK